MDTMFMQDLCGSIHKCQLILKSSSDIKGVLTAEIGEKKKALPHGDHEITYLLQI